MLVRYLYAAIICLFAACSTGTTKGKDEKPKILVSIAPQAAVAKVIAGDKFTVSTLLGRGSDPETFDPSASDRMDVDKADVYFVTGVLPFEERLEKSSENTVFANTSKGIALLYGTHGHAHDANEHGHGSEAPDPHYWSSVEGIRQMARNMATELCRLYPEQSGNFVERLADYEYHLDSIDSVFRNQLEKADKVFAVWHPSLSYFARDYGLEQISLGTEGKEMSAKSLTEAIDKAREKGVGVFFFQKEYDSRQAETISEGIGSKLVVINPMAEDWEKELTGVCNELSRP